MTKVEQRVDALVAAFDKWFQSYSPQGNEPLVRPERAIIKTFCYYLTQVNPDARPKLPVLEEKVEEDAQHRDSDVVLPVRPGGDAFRAPGVPVGPGVPGFGDPR